MCSRTQLRQVKAAEREKEREKEGERSWGVEFWRPSSKANCLLRNESDRTCQTQSYWLHAEESSNRVGRGRIFGCERERIDPGHEGQARKYTRMLFKTICASYVWGQIKNVPSVVYLILTRGNIKRHGRRFTVSTLRSNSSCPGYFFKRGTWFLADRCWKGIGFRFLSGHVNFAPHQARVHVETIHISWWFYWHHCLSPASRRKPNSFWLFVSPR